MRSDTAARCSVRRPGWLRHPAIPAESCCLPTLTRFTSGRCAGPGHRTQHRDGETVHDSGSICPGCLHDQGGGFHQVAVCGPAERRPESYCQGPTASRPPDLRHHYPRSSGLSSRASPRVSGGADVPGPRAGPGHEGSPTAEGGDEDPRTINSKKVPAKWTQGDHSGSRGDTWQARPWPGVRSAGHSAPDEAVSLTRLQSRRSARAAESARLEIVCWATNRGFKSHLLRSPGGLNSLMHLTDRSTWIQGSAVRPGSPRSGCPRTPTSPPRPLTPA
jgi:hypothetical protein